MAFRYFRAYDFPDTVKYKWEALKIVEEAERKGSLDRFFASHWIKLVGQRYTGIWGFVKKHTGY